MGLRRDTTPESQRVLYKCNRDSTTTLLLLPLTLSLCLSVLLLLPGGVTREGKCHDSRRLHQAKCPFSPPPPPPPRRQAGQAMQVMQQQEHTPMRERERILPHPVMAESNLSPLLPSLSFPVGLGGDPGHSFNTPPRRKGIELELEQQQKWMMVRDGILLPPPPSSSSFSFVSFIHRSRGCRGNRRR